MFGNLICDKLGQASHNLNSVCAVIMINSLRLVCRVFVRPSPPIGRRFEIRISACSNQDQKSVTITLHLGWNMDIPTRGKDRVKFDKNNSEKLRCRLSKKDWAKSKWRRFI